MNNLDDLAHELWAIAQLGAGEGIEDAVSRIARRLIDELGKGEPVAWLVVHDWGRENGTITFPTINADDVEEYLKRPETHTVTPLFTHHPIKHEAPAANELTRATEAGFAHGIEQGKAMAADELGQQEPDCEWIQSPHGNYPQLSWKQGYKAQIGDKFYLHPAQEVPEGQEPFAWVLPGDDNVSFHGFIDARITREGEFTRPVFTHPAPKQEAPDIKAMVDRFLRWKLPKDFSPDAGISFHAEYNVEYMAKQGKPPCRHEPIGTNLFSADQARAMLEYVMQETSEPAPCPICADTGKNCCTPKATKEAPTDPQHAESVTIPADRDIYQTLTGGVGGVVAMNLTNLRAIVAAATPGPWLAESKNVHAGQICSLQGDDDGWMEVWSEHWMQGKSQNANAAYIATFNPELIAKLLDLWEAADKHSDVIQDQFENGVKCLNEAAAAEFYAKYKDLAVWMGEIADAVTALEETE